MFNSSYLNDEYQDFVENNMLKIILVFFWVTFVKKNIYLHSKRVYDSILVC